MWSHLYDILEYPKLQEQQPICDGLPGAGDGGKRDGKETGWNGSEFCIWIMVVVYPLQLFVKMHSSVNQKMWAAAHKLYHNKTVLLTWVQE